MTKKEGMCNVYQNFGNLHIPSFGGAWGGPLRYLLYIIHPVKQSVPADTTKALTVWIA